MGQGGPTVLVGPAANLTVGERHKCSTTADRHLMKKYSSGFPSCQSSRAFLRKMGRRSRQKQGAVRFGGAKLFAQGLGGKAGAV